MRRWFVQDKAEEGDGGAAGAAAAATVVSGGAAPAAGGDAAAGAAAAAGAGAAADTKAKWPDTWRQELAAGDEKTLKRLERFQSPADIFTSYRALEQRLSSGELKANVPFPEKGTPEEQAKWRTEAGLPDKPEAYDLKFDDGFVIGEADKPMVDAFLKSAHAKNLPPSAVKESVRWYFDSLESRVKEQTEAENKYRETSEEELRAEWGQDFATNRNLVRGLIQTAPKDLQDLIMYARLSDGKPFTSHPGALKWMTSLARQLNPVTTVIPGVDSANMASSIDDEIAEIDKLMRTDRKAYNKDTKKQERYRELLDARARLNAQK